MKQSLLALRTVLCVGLAPLCSVSMVCAQTAPVSNPALVPAQPEPTGEDYVAMQKQAEEQLAQAKTPDQKAEALVGLGLSYSQRKMYAQAREQWTKIIESPEMLHIKFRAYSLIGVSYGEESNWSRARAEFQKAVALPVATTQEKASLGMDIGLSFFPEGNIAEGRKQLTALIENTELDPNFRAVVASQLGQALLDAGEFEPAREAFNLALSFRNTPFVFRTAVYVGIAKSFKTQDNEAKAQESFVKAQAQALAEMAVLAQAKRYEEARASAEMALTLGTVHPIMEATMQKSIAGFLMQEGKPEQARMRLEAYLQKPTDPNLAANEKALLLVLRQTMQLTIARSYAAQGNKEQARSVLQALLATEISNPGIKAEAEKALKELD